MRRIRLFGLAFLALFAFGVVMASTASASEGTEAGLLFLKGEEGPVSIKGSGGEAKLAAGKEQELKCEKTETKSDPEIEQEKGTHITLIKIHVHLLKCVEKKAKSELKCNSGEVEGEKKTPPAKS